MRRGYSPLLQAMVAPSNIHKFFVLCAKNMIPFGFSFYYATLCMKIILNNFLSTMQPIELSLVAIGLFILVANESLPRALHFELPRCSHDGLPLDPCSLGQTSHLKHAHM